MTSRSDATAPGSAPAGPGAVHQPGARCKILLDQGCFSNLCGPCDSDYAALVTYAVTEEQIAETNARYAALSCDTPKGYEEVRLAIAEVRDARVAVEKRRVELKADALAYGRLVDSKAKELTAMLLEIEEPLKAKKQAVDDEKARIRAEAEAAKRAAIEAEIATRRAEEEEKARLVREAEERRLAEVRAALEAERAKLAEAQAALEAARKAEEDRREAERKAEEERLAAIRRAEEERLAVERRAEEERQRAERAALEAERKAVAAAREAQERAEFERQAKLRAEREAAEKAERAKREATEAEARRPDVEKVRTFAAQLREIAMPTVNDAVLADALVVAWDALGSIADELERAAAQAAA